MTGHGSSMRMVQLAALSDSLDFIADAVIRIGGVRQRTNKAAKKGQQQQQLGGRKRPQVASHRTASAMTEDLQALPETLLALVNR